MLTDNIERYVALRQSPGFRVAQSLVRWYCSNRMTLKLKLRRLQIGRLGCIAE